MFTKIFISEYPENISAGICSYVRVFGNTNEEQVTITPREITYGKVISEDHSILSFECGDDLIGVFSIAKNKKPEDLIGEWRVTQKGQDILNALDEGAKIDRSEVIKKVEEQAALMTDPKIYAGMLFSKHKLEANDWPYLLLCSTWQFAFYQEVNDENVNIGKGGQILAGGETALVSMPVYIGGEIEEIEDRANLTDDEIKGSGEFLSGGLDDEREGALNSSSLWPMAYSRILDTFFTSTIPSRGGVLFGVDKQTKEDQGILKILDDVQTHDEVTIYAVYIDYDPEGLIVFVPTSLRIVSKGDNFTVFFNDIAPTDYTAFNYFRSFDPSAPNADGGVVLDEGCRSLHDELTAFISGFFQNFVTNEQIDAVYILSEELMKADIQLDTINETLGESYVTGTRKPNGHELILQALCGASIKEAV